MTTVSKWFAELFGFGLKGAKAEAAKAEAAKAEAAKVEEAVKTEIPVVVKSSNCGCGRSPTGSCLGLHKLTEEEWATHEVNPNRIVAAVVDDPKEVEQKIETAIKKQKKAKS